MKKKKSTKEKKSNYTGFALGKLNYRLIAIGFAIIVIGFILMVGGGSDDPDVFNPEIFSFRRITLAPIILLFGFVFEIYAILKKPKENE
jgi:membrane-bound ClpP family serine protease